jgi:hypothetical protein
MNTADKAAYKSGYEKGFADARKMMLNRQQKIDEIIKKAKKQCCLDGFDFSILMQNLLISENGYVIDTGNWKNANCATALMLYDNIKRHPRLWKKFFMVA